MLTYDKHKHYTSSTQMQLSSQTRDNTALFMFFLYTQLHHFPAKWCKHFYWVKARVVQSINSIPIRTTPDGDFLKSNLGNGRDLQIGYGKLGGWKIAQVDEPYLGVDSGQVTTATLSSSHNGTSINYLFKNLKGFFQPSLFLKNCGWPMPILRVNTPIFTQYSNKALLLWSTVSYLKALYTGLYQHTKEQGVKSTNQRIENPKFRPALLFSMLPEIAKYVREPIKLRNKVHMWTENTNNYCKSRGEYGIC